MDGTKNHNFVQVSKSYMDEYAKLIQDHPAAASLLMLFASRMSRTNAIVISYTGMQELTGYSRQTVATAIKVLKSQRWIDSIKIGGVTAYGVNEKFAWQTASNRRRYAEFSCHAIAAESEQPRERKQPEKIRHMPVVSVEAH